MPQTWPARCTIRMCEAASFGSVIDWSGRTLSVTSGLAPAWSSSCAAARCQPLEARCKGVCPSRFLALLNDTAPLSGHGHCLTDSSRSKCPEVGRPNPSSSAPWLAGPALSAKLPTLPHIAACCETSPWMSLCVESALPVFTVDQLSMACVDGGCAQKGLAPTKPATAIQAEVYQLHNLDLCWLRLKETPQHERAHTHMWKLWMALLKMCVQG